MSPASGSLTLSVPTTAPAAFSATLAFDSAIAVGAGILQRHRYSDHPQRFEYHLTAAGRDLYPVILTLLRWGDEHLAGLEGPPLVLEHNCGHRLIPELTCQACGEVIDPAETTRRPPTSS